MHKSLQTKCLSNSQRRIQSDTLRDQTITLRRVSGTSSHFVGVDMNLGVWRRLDSGGRWVQLPRSWWARRSQPSRTLDQKSLQDYFTAVRLHLRKTGN